MTDFKDIPEEVKWQALCAQNALAWTMVNKINLGHGIWRKTGHEYLEAILRCEAKKQCAKKGAQMGLSETWVLKTLHGQIYGRYPTGALYLFPTKGDVEDFSKMRFDPLLSNNPCIGSHVRETDKVNVKAIGGGFLVLRGARSTKKIGDKKSSSGLKTVPVDRIVFDERDEMEDEMIDLALERISHSKIQEEMYLSTPTIPDYGIDALYQNSDQRIWMIKCEACGKETCLELEFPSCIKERTDGTCFRACIHCGAEIHPRNGTWIAQYPGKEMVGWWISQLNSVFVDPGKILNLYRNPPHGNIAEVYNSKLGVAYIAAENRLSINDIYDCCKAEEAMKIRHDGPTAMGFDIGKDFHVIIGDKPSAKRLRIVKIAKVTSESDVYDLAKRFNVKSSVCDKYPETRTARKMAKNLPGKTYLCGYQDGKKRGITDWNDRDGEILGNRTELCDSSHELVTTPGAFELPRRDSEIKEYAKQMCNMVKVLDEDPQSGAKYYNYRKIGLDHFRHATNYFQLAAERIGTVKSRGRSMFRRKKRTAMSA